MASEIRVDKINSLSGVGTVTLSPTGVDIAGITTAATLRATTGIVTSLTAGSLTSLGAVSGTTGTFSGAVSGTTGTFSGAVSGTTGTFTGDVDIADKIIHTGDTDTLIRFPSADNIQFDVGSVERLNIDNVDGVTVKHTTAANLRIENSTAATSQVAQLDMAPAGQVSGVQLKCTSEEDFSTGANRTAYFSVHNRKDGTFYERLRIDSSGKIGIGGAPSAWQAATTTKALQIGNSCLFNYNDTYFHLGQNFYFDGSNYKLINNGWATRLMQNDGEFKFLVSDASGSAGDNINFQQKLRVTTGGDVDVEDGDIFFSTSGKGIVLGNTSNVDANTLDDYEEGSWTPAISGVTYNDAQGTYIKIGRTCFVTLTLNGSNTSKSGDTRITGLPFTPKVGPGEYYPANSIPLFEVSGISLASGYNNMYLRIDDSQGNLQILVTDGESHGILTAGSGTTLNSNHALRTSFTYETNA